MKRKRKLKIKPIDQAAGIVSKLFDLDGILHVEHTNDNLKLSYDLTKIRLDEITTQLEKNGYEIGMTNFRKKYINYVELNEQKNHALKLSMKELHNCGCGINCYKK